MGRRIEKVEHHNIAVTTAAISTLPYWNQGGGLSKLVINLNNNIALKQQQHVLWMSILAHWRQVDK